MSDRFFKGWFILCGLIGLALTAGMIWLIVAVIQWIGRH